MPFPLLKPFRALKRKWTAANHRRQKKRFYAQFVKPGGLCYDIGANIGDRTDVFRQLGAKVVAVEPQTSCVNKLRERFGKDSGVSIVPAGVAGALGKGKLALSSASTVVASFSPQFREKWRGSGKVQWESEETVELTTLDELIKMFGMPEFCKIDVEGFEEQVLSGLSQVLPALSFEFNIELLEQAQKCITRLQDLGCTRFNYSLGESMLLELNEWVIGDRLIQLIKTHEDPLCWGDIYAMK